MCSSTKIEKSAVSIKGDFSPSWISSSLRVCRFADPFLDHFDRLLAGNFDFLKPLVSLMTFFISASIASRTSREGDFRVEIVVETGFSGWPDVQLGVGVQAKNRGGKDVSGGMPDFFQWSHFLHVGMSTTFARWFLQRQERKLVFEVDIRTQPLHRLLQGPAFTGGIILHLVLPPRIRR